MLLILDMAKKEKVAGKSCPLFENIYLYFARFDDKI
jgi:hypothetical protein